MADVDITYDDIMSAAKKVETAATGLTDLLGRVTKAIDGLVGSEFATATASDEFDTQVTSFVTNTTNGVKALQNIAQFLPQIAETYRSTDSGLASGISGGK